MDEARVGRKGRLCHRWWARGRRPPGRRDKRFEWAYVFAAVEPATGADVALVLPEATTATMGLFLAGFAARLPKDAHAAAPRLSRRRGRPRVAPLSPACFRSRDSSREHAGP